MNKYQNVLSNLRKNSENVNFNHPFRTRHVTEKLLSRPVYLGDQLNKYHRGFLFETKKLAKEKGIKFVWVLNYLMHIRKREDA